MAQAAHRIPLPRPDQWLMLPMGWGGGVIDAKIETLICSCQTGRHSGRYLGPKEKIKADKALLSRSGKKPNGGKEGESPHCPSPSPESELAVTLRRELGGGMDLGGDGEGSPIRKPLDQWVKKGRTSDTCNYSFLSPLGPPSTGQDRPAAPLAPRLPLGRGPPTAPSSRQTFFLPFFPTRFSFPLSAFPIRLAFFLPFFPVSLAPLFPFLSPALNNAEPKLSPADLLSPYYPLYSQDTHKFRELEMLPGRRRTVAAPPPAHLRVNPGWGGCHGRPKNHLLSARGKYRLWK